MTRHLLPMHPRRRQRSEELARRDPETDWQAIYRQLVLWEFTAEARSGFQVALYRPQAVPRMAAVLAGTGHIRANPGRRTIDTGIVILELIHGGFDSDRGRKMVRLMRALHDRPDIHQEDLTYVLNSLIVVPTRFIEKVGWRPLSASEKTASWRWWQELGSRMDIVELPASYEDAEEQFDRYEAANLASSPEGQQLTELILTAFADWVPKPLSPHLGQITSALIDDPQFSLAIGLEPARRPARTFVRLLHTTRRLQQRLSPPEKEPGFTPGQVVDKVYPTGYDINRIGPTG